MKAYSIAELTTNARAQWLTAWEAGDRGNSPFLHPGYAAAVARAGRKVVVFADLNHQAFFALEQHGRSLGGAVGGRLADVSGALWPKQVPFDLYEAFRLSGLRGWDLNNCCESTPGQQTVSQTFSSPFVDLRRGVEGWEQDLRNQGRRSMVSIKRKARKLAAEVGTLRLVTGETDVKLLRQLLHWKKEQRIATGTVDPFREQWARRLVEDFQRYSQDGLYGSLDCLYAGDTLVAAHMGLRTDQRLHWWVPAYSHTFSKYSPGLVLMLELARHAVGEGIEQIDLGPGDERYKLSLSNNQSTLNRVHARRYGAERRLHGLQLCLRKKLRGSPLEEQIKSVRSTAVRIAGELRG